ncbi:MAG: hypothetical protein ACYDD4_04610 [Acidimicrobiales bacterium]
MWRPTAVRSASSKGSDVSCIGWPDAWSQQRAQGAEQLVVGLALFSHGARS